MSFNKRKKYSVYDREKYHKSRLQDPRVSEKKKIYSRHWLDGFTDERANVNYIPTRNERDWRIKNGQMYNRAVYDGYLNGAKAQFEKRKLKRR